MANKLYEESDIADIAEAIRGQNGTLFQYKVSEMAQAIREITAGVSVSAASGTFTPTSDDYDDLFIAHELGAIPDVVVIMGYSRSTTNDAISLYAKNSVTEYCVYGQNSSARLNPVSWLSANNYSFTISNSSSSKFWQSTRAYKWYAIKL